eukprot:684427-Rhodomonas_salina.3
MSNSTTRLVPQCTECPTQTVLQPVAISGFEIGRASVFDLSSLPLLPALLILLTQDDGLLAVACCREEQEKRQ